MGMDEHQRDVEIEHQGDDDSDDLEGEADEPWGADESIGDADSPGT